LPLDSRFSRINVEIQMNDPFSMLSLYKRLIELRQKEPCLITGNYRPLYSDHQIIAYYRQLSDNPGFLIVLNLSHRPCYFTTNRISIKGKIEIATSPELENTLIDGKLSLSGDQGVIIRLS
jgi:alpha-glucosidase